MVFIWANNTSQKKRVLKQWCSMLWMLTPLRPLSWISELFWKIWAISVKRWKPFILDLRLTENTRSDYRDDMFFGELRFTCKNVSFHTQTQSSNESRSEELLFHDGLVCTVALLKMIFQSVLRSLSTLMFMDIIGSHSLRTTYLIFKAFQTLFPTALSIFTMAKLFYQVI